MKFNFTRLLASYRPALLVLLINLFSVSPDLCATVYVSTADGEWHDASNWTPSVPPAIVLAGDCVLVRHDLVVYTAMTINVFGHLSVEGSVSDELLGETTFFIFGNLDVKIGGTAHIEKIGTLSGGILDNKGTIHLLKALSNAGTTHNLGIMFIAKTPNSIDNSGTFNNCGNLKLMGSIQNDGIGINCATGSIHSLGNFRNNSGSSFTNEGLINVSGNFQNDGDFEGTGQLNMCGNFSTSNSGSFDGDMGVCINGNITDPNEEVNIYCDYSITDICPMALPVELLSFYAEDQPGGIQLRWVTGKEEGNSHFVVEFSNDGGRFEAVGAVDAVENPDSLNRYDFFHQPAAAYAYFYRLKQVDVESDFTYSEIISVTESGAMPKTVLRCYPNPVSGNFLHVETSENSHILRISVKSLQGKELIRIPVMEEGASRQTMILDGQLPNGIYLLEAETESGVTCRKISINM